MPAGAKLACPVEPALNPRAKGLWLRGNARACRARRTIYLLIANAAVRGFAKRLQDGRCCTEGSLLWNTFNAFSRRLGSHWTTGDVCGATIKVRSHPDCRAIDGAVGAQACHASVPAGSPTEIMTTAIEVVDCFAANAHGAKIAASTSTFRRISSPANSGSRLALPTADEASEENSAPRRDQAN
jgi:hypothetical protein